MNETLEVIKSRKSVRAYLDKPIPQEIKNEILEAAFQAPTAGNMMLYTILDITDQSLKDRLAESCDHQPFIARAPLVLIFLADYQRWYDTFLTAGCEPRTPAEGDLLLACADAIIAAQNTVIAAESLGIGSCYIGDILENCENVRSFLNLPDYAIPAAMVVYGYPAENQKTRPKPARFEKEYIVYENQYRELKPEEHTAMHETQQAKNGRKQDVREHIQAFCKRKFMSDFSLEMNRSAAQYLQAFRKSGE